MSQVEYILSIGFGSSPIMTKLLLWLVWTEDEELQIAIPRNHMGILKDTLYLNMGTSKGVLTPRDNVRSMKVYTFLKNMLENRVSYEDAVALASILTEELTHADRR
jgi:hypothetical protein